MDLESNLFKINLENIKILIVEDEVDFNEILTFTIETLGGTVIAVNSTQAALTVLEEFLPDIILSDIRLPDGSGYSLIEAIKSKDKFLGKNIPVIAITGVAYNQETSKSLSQAGFEGYLSKPFEIKALLELIIKLTQKNRNE